MDFFEESGEGTRATEIVVFVFPEVARRGRDMAGEEYCALDAAVRVARARRLRF